MARWKHKKKEYLRVVHGREAVNLSALLAELAKASEPFAEKPPTLVQFAIRDARFHPKDGLGPSRAA